MATLAEIAYSIRNQLEGQVVSDDHRLRLKFIQKQIRGIRSLLLAEELNKGIGIDQGFLQVIECLEVKCDRVTCNGNTMPFKTHFVNVPPITMVGNNPVYLGLLDGATPFERVSYASFLNWTGGSFSFKRPAYSLIDNMALLKFFPTGTKWIRLVAALDDPMNGGCVILKEKDPYPLPERLIYQLELLVIKQLLSTLPIPGDMVNDGTDMAPQQPKRR